MYELRLFGLVFALGLLLSGCMMPPQTKPLGTAVRMTIAQQIADPKASTRMDAGLRLDGRAGAALMERYHLSFEGTKTQAGAETMLKAIPIGTIGK